VEPGEPWDDLGEHLTTLVGDVVAALDDDLNIAGALAAIFNFLRQVNSRLDQRRLDQDGAQAILQTFRELDQVLGVMNFPEAAADEAIAALVAAREAARQQKDWARADQLRQELASQGIEVWDTPTGPIWRRRQG
jgi:cysteinyl-tRNA synthetase